MIEIIEYPRRRFRLGELFTKEGLVVAVDGQPTTHYKTLAPLLTSVGKKCIIVSNGAEYVSYTIYVTGKLDTFYRGLV